MKVPINWLKEYVTLPKNESQLTDALTMAGHMLDKTEVINGGKVIDLELRGNRADCYSIMGIAREVKALFNTKYHSPKIHADLRTVKRLKGVDLKINSAYVERVMMVTVRDVKITQSPKWLKDKLVSYGVPSINNIVDLTNFVMIETGQPMHAFDLDVLGENVEIRLAKSNEKITTLQGTVVNLTDEDLVWAKEGQILSIAGAIGGKSDSITNSTRNILLEAAKYDRANIRRTIHRHNLFTDAGIRHEKELDPNLVEFGIYRYLQLVKDNNWGKIDDRIFDNYPKKVTDWEVSLNYEFLYSRSGLQIIPKNVKSIISSLGFEVVKENKNGLAVRVPTYRTDVTCQEDLVEEVIRIYGYDKIPTKTLSLAIPEDITPSYIRQEDKIRGALTALSFNEVITLPFVAEKRLNQNKNTIKESVSAINIANRPSHDIEQLRLSLLPNLSEVTEKTIDERGSEARLFEIGKVYIKNAKKYTEERKVGIVYWRSATSFEVFKGMITSFFTKMNLPEPQYVPSESNFANSYSIHINNDLVGAGGQVKDIYYVEIDLDKILDKEGGEIATIWPKYPPQIEDITFEIPEGKYIGELVQLIRDSSSLVKEVEMVDSYMRNFTFRIYYQNNGKTLTDQEVEKIRKKILHAVEKKLDIATKD